MVVVTRAGGGGNTGLYLAILFGEQNSIEALHLTVQLHQLGFHEKCQNTHSVVGCAGFVQHAINILLQWAMLWVALKKAVPFGNCSTELSGLISFFVTCLALGRVSVSVRHAASLSLKLIYPMFITNRPIAT
jgi:hypothetical protein